MKLFQSVLIVDDRPDSARLTEMALSIIDEEIRTERVSSGEAALAYLEAAFDLPALLLIDLNMPGMTGIETLRAIRADERIKYIPVVVMTLSCLESDEVAARAAGATGFVQKAIRIKEFSDDLKQYIK